MCHVCVRQCDKCGYLWQCWYLVRGSVRRRVNICFIQIKFYKFTSAYFVCLPSVHVCVDVCVCWCVCLCKLALHVGAVIRVECNFTRLKVINHSVICIHLIASVCACACVCVFSLAINLSIIAESVVRQHWMNTNKVWWCAHNFLSHWGVSVCECCRECTEHSLVGLRHLPLKLRVKYLCNCAKSMHLWKLLVIVVVVVV